MQIYIVKSGDTVDTIALATGTFVQSIIYANQLQYPYQLAIGQALLLFDNDMPESPSEEQPLITVNGYAYPFISSSILNATLPYLSELSVFSYGFTADGDLLAPIIEPSWMITQANQYQTAALLTLTPLDEEGQFNNYLIHEMVRSDEARQNLISQLYNTIETLGYAGVDIDFEYILAEDRDYFTNFVGEVADALRPFGYQTSVALAPKTSAEQVGLLYEGKDYKALGEVADRVLLMTYEWGYKYSEPKAVAPINMVKRVVDYAITEIPADKIHLGIPNYGYDWSLPYEKGVTQAKTIGNVEAVEIAVKYNAEIKYDTIAQTPYFNYVDNNTEHEVWFEDVRSMQAKFDLIKQYQLAGAGYWQIMRLFLANWLLLADNFEILKLG